MKAFILMADVINSSSMPGKELMDDFSVLVKKANKAFKDQLSSPLTITLGDEFQGVVKELTGGIEVMLFLEEFLISEGHKYELRYILHQGEIDTDINKKEAYKMLGKGLTEAREKLNASKKSDHRFVFTLDDNFKEETLNQAFYLYEMIIDDWNEKDFSVVKLFLSGKNYREVAEIIDRDESSVWRREKSLKIKAYNTSKELIKNIANA